RIRNLHASYGNVQVIKGVSLHVGPGEIVTIIGANGAGKSTLLKTISGLIPSAIGEIYFNDKPIIGIGADKIVRLGVSHVPEGRKIFDRLSVGDNLDLGAFSRVNRKEVDEDLDKVWSLFPILKKRYHQKGGTLSGGEQQMLAIARALMSRPKLIMMDEPSMGLAPKMVHQVFRIIRDLKEMGTTILLIEQNARAALSVADRGYVMEIGKFILDGQRTSLLNNNEVKRAYLGKGEVGQ
ncbi:MAG: ABC transporter ATP-binding protein, partial [Candidatus Dadabacteria bacterium]|nr:ABC transporter ATP-binding protein [Candidatus Dadabacteria bacterium]